MDTEGSSDDVAKSATTDDKTEEAAKVQIPDSKSFVVADLMDAGLVKPAEQFKFNFQIGKTAKKISADDKTKLFEMVKGLAKFNDCEEELNEESLKIPAKQRMSKSPSKAPVTKEKSSLSDLIDSELAVLHTSDENKLKSGDVSGSTPREVDKKSKKTGVHVASVSDEKQLEFESLLKEDIASTTKAIEDIQISARARPKVLVTDEAAEAEQADINNCKERVEPVNESHESKGEKKKKSPKKKGKAKGVQGEGQEGTQEIGSYSQLLKTMGRKSQGRNTELFLDEKTNKRSQNDQRQKIDKATNQTREKTEEKSPVEGQGQVQGQGKKKKNKKQKGNQQGEPVLEEQKVERPQSAAKGKTKGKGSPHVAQEKMQPNRPNSAQSDSSQSTQGSTNQKKKNKRGSMESSEPIQYVASKPDDSYTELSVRVPKQEHIYILGPQGRHIQEIMMVTGVTVSVPPLNSMSEEVVLRGEKMQLGPAVALMFSKSQMESNAMMGGAVSPVFQGRGNFQDVMSCVGQGKRQQMPKKGQGYKNRDPDVGNDLTINVNLNQQGKGNKRQHERYVTSTPPQQIYREYVTSTPIQHGPNHHYNSAPSYPHHHVVSTPVHHGQRPVKGQQSYQQGVHLHQQRHGRHNQGQGHPHQQGQTPGSACKSQGKRQRKKKVLFAEYLPMDEVSQGLKRGTLVEGPIRINPKNFEEAYVPHPDCKSDILVCGLKGRNRALNGDIVAVELLEEGDWKLNRNELEDLERSMTYDKGEGSSQDSDQEVVIESEEIVEISTKDDTPSKGENLTEKSKDETKRDNRSPKKRYTSLGDMMTGQSPARQKLLTEEGRDEIKKMLQRTGKVVAIIERKHSRACSGFIKPMQDKSTDKALFSPTDHRVPRVIIPMHNCPKDFLERPDDYARTLYVCRITDWKVDNYYAQGCLAKSLGEAGEIEPETEGMLLENGVDFDDFPKEALDCLPKLSPWTIPVEEFNYRRDFRSACVFTIDPATARDLDDAVSCEDLGDGKFKVGVHIADVSFFLEENSVLDKVAGLRSTSVYLVHKVIPMLPRLLCEELCSLNPDVDRLTFSVEWIITEQGEIEEEWFGRSVICSCAKLSYDHAQGFIEEPDRNWTTEELPPISEGFTVDDIKSRVLNLQKIAVNLRKARMDGGALRLDQVKLQYSLDEETGLPNGYWVYQQRDSNRLIEEFMLLANMAVAHRINSEFPDLAVLRKHPPPQAKMVENLKELCSALGIHIDISSAGAIQRSLRTYAGDDDESMARMQVLVALCAKPMQTAKYFCTGCIDDESLYHHYALNVPLYTHFTSPIRRYPDVLVHRLLAASLEYCEAPSQSPRDIQRLADHANDKKTAAKRVGDLSSELFFAVFVKTTGPLEEKAMVMGVLDKAFDIFVLRLGVSKRVYCDKLPIKEKIFKRERKVPSLVLVWPSEGGEPDVRQEISIFSIVECVLEQGELPLQWTAVIKRPEAMPSLAFTS